MPRRTAAHQLLALVAGLAFAAPAALAQSHGGGERHATVPRVIERADSLLAAHRVEPALTMLEAHLATSPDDLHARWRAARAAVYLGILENGTDVENSWFRRGMAHADIALRRDPNDLDAMRWALAAKGNLAVQTGIAESARLAQEVWTLARRVLTLEPDCSDAHYAIGKIQYELLKLNRAERLLSRPFRLGEMGKPSWPEAVRYAERAVQLDPASALYRIGLADTLWRVGRHAEAIAQLEVARGLPPRTAVDVDFRERASGLLDRIAKGEDPTK